MSLTEVVPRWVINSGCSLARSAPLILPVLAAAVAVLTVGATTGLDLLVDQRLFTTAGCQILDGQVGTAYSNALLQSGPLQNTLYCAVSKVTPLASPTLWFALGAAAVVLGILAGLRLVSRQAGLDPTRPVIAVAGGYVALWSISTMMTMHSAELAGPVLWAAGAVLVRRRPLAAGVVLGASVGFELWGLVALPIVFAAATWRSRAAAGALAAATGAGLILPFAAAGHLAMFHFKWPVQPHTLPALIWPVSLDGTNGQFGLVPRLVQVALACSGCALVAYRTRNQRRLLLWAPAMAAEFLRLLIDPTMYTYYWVVPELLATVALVCAITVRERVLIGVLAVLQVVGELNYLRVGVVALSIVLVAWMVLINPARSHQHAAVGAVARNGVTAIWAERSESLPEPGPFSL